MKNLIIAWLASSFAFSVAFICFMLFWAWLDDGTLRWSAIPRLAYVTVGAAVTVQFFYGALVYFVLTRTGLWNVWMVALAYLLPVLVIAWFTVDTTREAWGTIAWVIFACIVAFVFWFLAPAHTGHKTS
jgi:hypothetical protein